MGDDNPETNHTYVKSVRQRRWWSLPLRITAWILGGTVMLSALVCIALNLWLTPERLSGLVSEYAGRYLDADVRMGKISFTIWSTFPHFELQADSATVVSRRLRGLTPRQRSALPADADTLACFTRLSGSVNPLKLLYGRLSMRRLNITGLRLNMVSLNDSVNNYDILPAADTDKPFVMPRFEIGEIQFSRLRPITWFSATTGASARIDLQKVSMKSIGPDSYRLRLSGLFGLQVEKLKLLSDFPFSFSGKVNVKFKPFRVSFDRYNISLGNVRSQVDLSMRLGDNRSQLTSLRYSVNPFDMLRLFEYLPADWLPRLRAIHSNATLQASARLTSPYRFSSDSLPDFEVDFRVPDSWLSYSLQGQPDVKMHNIGLEARLVFDGDRMDESRFIIDRLSLAGEGLEADLKGSVTNLLSSPSVTAEVDAEADLQRLQTLVPALGRLRLKGRARTKITTTFPIDALTSGQLYRIPVYGVATLKNMACAPRKSHMRISGDEGKIAFGQKNSRLTVYATFDRPAMSSGKGCDIAARSLTIHATCPSAASADSLHISGNIAALRVNGADYAVRAKKMRLKASAPASLIADMSLWRKTPVKVGLIAENATGSAYADSVILEARRLSLSGRMLDMNLSARAAADGARYSDPLNFGILESLYADIGVNIHGVIPAAARGTVVAMLDLLRPYGHVRARQGRFVSVTYPAITDLQALDIDITPSAFTLNRIRLRSQGNAVDIKGSIGNYRAMLPHCAGPQDKVTADFNICADTIDINKIAGTCRAGQLLLARWRGMAPPSAMPPDTGPRPSDFRPVLLPRWLDARLRMSAKQCTYTNLHVLGIKAGMRVGDGIFRLDSIRAHTDFGAAHARATYTGADSLNMGAECEVALDSINVVTFFRRFHTLLEMMPQMSNLSGSVSVTARGQFSLFPDMTIELPSLTATVNAAGRDLRVHQSEFIHRVCRFLLINNHDDLRIHNINVRATVHADQLELYPFTFEMDRYRLRIMGENDFAGNMYYHISVLRSPLPFRFGINITGKFDDYRIRFGGPRFNSDRAIRNMQLIEHHHINIVTELRWLASKFMQKAAEADNTRTHAILIDSVGRKLNHIHDTLLTRPLKEQ